MVMDNALFLDRLRRLRPIDDEFMRCIFRDNIPLAQLVLRILIEKPDLVITRIETQKDLKRLAGARSICLDAYGTDSTGKKYDLEVDRFDARANPHRARYHSSALDIENLNAGQSFEELPETYTIFYTEHDPFQLGKPFYRIERVNLDAGNALFHDGAHIRYINGAYRGNSDFGKLAHDFCCSNPEEMHFALMRSTTRYYKESEKGVKTMSRIFEEVLQEGIEKERVSNIKNLMDALKLTAAQAMDILKVPSDERARYAALLG